MSLTMKLENMLSRNRWLSLLFLLIWILLITGYWLPRHWLYYGAHDHDLTYSTFETVRKSIQDYGQFPQFNPWSARGTDLLADPQAVTGNPFMFLTLLFGSFYGVKLLVLLFWFIGGWGMLRLSARLGADRTMALGSAFLFTGASYFSWHILVAGHSNFAWFLLLPWMADAILDFARREGGFSWYNFLVPVLIFALMAGGGAPFVALYVALAMGLFAIFLPRQLRNKALIRLLFTGILSLGIAGWKVLPVLMHFSDYPRIVSDPDGVNPFVWLQAMADHPVDTRTPHGWHEFGTGLSLILLIWVLVYFRSTSGNWRWYAPLLLLIWLSLGNWPEYLNPWYWLNSYVPPFTSLRSPTRVMIMIYFVIVIMFIYTIIKNRELYNTGKIILFGAVLTLMLRSMSLAETVSETPFADRMKFPPAAAGMQVIRLGPGELQFPAIRQGYVVMNTYDPLDIAPLKDSSLLPARGGRILTFTPNRIRVHKDSAAAVINLRWMPGWTADNQHLTLARSEYGTIEVHGNYTGEFAMHYRNPWLSKGIVLSLLSVLVTALPGFFFFRRKAA